MATAAALAARVREAAEGDVEVVGNLVAALRLLERSGGTTSPSAAAADTSARATRALAALRQVSEWVSE